MYCFNTSIHDVWFEMHVNHCHFNPFLLLLLLVLLLRYFPRANELGVGASQATAGIAHDQVRAVGLRD